MRIFYILILSLSIFLSNSEVSYANGIDSLEVNIIACDSINNTYDIWLVVGVSNLNIDSLVVNVNDNGSQTFAVNDSIFIYNIVPEPNTLFDFLWVCATNDPNCCGDIQYTQPDCLSSNGCNIEVIEENIIACDTIDGSYDMEIYYDIVNDPNGFYFLYINGNIVDTFQNGDDLVVYDIMPMPNSNFDVITICASDLNCCLEYEYDQPDCESQSGNCEIQFIEEEIIDCHNDGSYDMQIFYSIENPTDDFIDLWVNNEFIGFFEIGDSLIVFDIEPRANSDYDIITICVNDNPNCCFSYEYFPPNCGSSDDCEIVFIEEEIFNCDSIDGNYDMQIFYQIEDANNDFIDLWVNNEFVGFFEIGDSLFVFDVAPRQNSDYDIITICVNDNPDCCLSYEYFPPNCGSSNDCFIEEIEHELIACDTIDGTYDVEIFYDIANDSSDFYFLYVNGNVIDTFQNGDDLFAYDIIPLANSNVDVITICSSDLGCCLEYEYDQPDCNGQNSDCEILYIEADDIVCNQDGSYDVVFYYDIENPGGDSIEVFLNNDLEGSFEISDVISFENVFPRPNSDYDFIKICVEDNPDCCYEYEYLQPDCDSTDCEVLFVEAEIFACDSIEGTYDMQIFYQIENANNDFLNLWVNNEFIDSIIIGDSIALFNVIPRSNGSYDIITICVNDNPECCLSYEYLQPDCFDDGVCNVNFIEESIVECNADGSYDMQVFYEVGNADNEIMNVWINNEPAGNFEVGDSLFFNEIVPRSNSDYDIIEICIDDFPNCCLAYEYMQPDCDTTMACNVNISNVEIVYCDSITGHYDMGVTFDIQNPTDDSVRVWVNGNLEAVWTLEQSDLLTNIEPNEFVDFDDVKICVGDNNECCTEYSYMQPICLSSNLTELSLQNSVQYIQGSLILTDLKDYNVILSDVTGRPIMNQLIQSNQENLIIDLNNIGIYFLTVYNQEGSASMKLLIGD